MFSLLVSDIGRRNLTNGMKSHKMSEEFSKDQAKKLREEAKWSYDKKKEEFYYRMLEIVFLKMKILLNEKGLKKVAVMDSKRDLNENFGVKFSQKTWTALAEAWRGQEGIAMSKIADLYGLEMEDFEL